MKKRITCFLSVIILAGCAAQTQSSNESVVEEITTPISQTDFTKSDAENVFNMAVRNHCKLFNQVCTVDKVVLQDNNIYGTYSYSENEVEYIVSGALENVAVSKTNRSIVTIGRKTFSSAVASNEEQSDDALSEETVSQDTTLPHFDLASEVNEDTQSSSEWILEEDEYKILLLNIASGVMNFNGTYEGTGTYEIYALSLDQSSAVKIVSLQASGTFDETTDLSGGWYYIVVKKTDGTATLNWAAQ